MAKEKKGSKENIHPPAEEKIDEVMHEFKEGELHVGKSDKTVTDRKQAIAIALSEASKLDKDKPNP